MPQVSVIIPTYNQAEHVKRAIESVLKQTYTDYELIIVNDGSTDNTAQVLAEYANKDKRIKIITQDNSGAPARPTNRGIKESQGKYIAVLQHDDEWYPEKLAKQVAFLEDPQNAKYAMVVCDAFFISDTKVKIEIVRQPAQSLEAMLNNCIMPFVSAPLIKKEALDAAGDFDVRFKIMDDYDYWLRFTEAGFLYANIPETLLVYHRHAGNITRSSAHKKWMADYLLLAEKHRAHYRAHPRNAKNFIGKNVRFFLSRPVDFIKMYRLLLNSKNRIIFFPEVTGRILFFSVRRIFIK